MTRAAGEDVAHVWESDGLEGYTIEDGERDHRGTDVILTLKEDVEGTDGAEGERYSRYLERVGARRTSSSSYSNYVRHPIQMMMTKSRQKPKPEDAPEDYKPEYEDYTELETINSMTPIWKKRGDVEQKDYDEFYKSTFHDWEDPARTITFHAEGALEYDALLFIPGKAPFDLYSKDYEEGPGALQLQRPDHGQVRGSAARLLQLRPRRRGLAGRHAQHLARDAAAEPPAARHRQPHREEGHERASGHARPGP